MFGEVLVTQRAILKVSWQTSQRQDQDRHKYDASTLLLCLVAALKFFARRAFFQIGG